MGSVRRKGPRVLRKATALVVPGRLETRTGGYLYDARVADGLRARGWDVAVHEIDGPGPVAASLASIPAHTPVLIDGLAFGAWPRVMASASARVRLVPIVHLPLAEAVGLAAGAARELEASEREALRYASCVIATGRSTVATLERYGVPPQAIVLGRPGTDPAPLATPPGAGPLQLLCVATLNPGKGHRMLLESLAAASTRDWHLTCAGSLDRSAATVAEVRTLVEQLNLGEHVTLAGELGQRDLDECYQQTAVFLLATHQETFGMAVAEALARGIPVVSTDTGAIAELAGTAAGLIVPPGDAAAFRDAVARMLGDASLRARLAGGAREVRQHLPSWDATLDKIETALHGIER